jgi:hypothetical protein
MEWKSFGNLLGYKSTNWSMKTAHPHTPMWVLYCDPRFSKYGDNTHSRERVATGLSRICNGNSSRVGVLAPHLLLPRPVRVPCLLRASPALLSLRSMTLAGDGGLANGWRESCCYLRLHFVLCGDCGHATKWRLDEIASSVGEAAL